MCLCTWQYQIHEATCEGSPGGNVPKESICSNYISQNSRVFVWHSWICTITWKRLQEELVLLSLADTTVGVFHLRSPLGQYRMTYEQAREACANESATIATYNQLLYAQKVRRPL